jgi:DNA-binding NtrC family response regulator
MYKILLVDDEQNVLNALRRELQQDYSIEAFNNPHAALQRGKDTPFDLVIADYKMPEMNGIEFLKQFGQQRPDAVRLMLSGQADFNALIDSINETHIYRFMEKPWDKTELAITLAEALAHREQVLKNRQLAEQCRKQRNWKTARDPQRIYQVLVVDDEQNVLSAIARDINARGGFSDMQIVMQHQSDPSAPVLHRDLHFNVHTATSPLQALERAKQTSFDVVISDYLMPEMNGLQFFSSLQDIQPEAVRILLSGQADKDALVAAINCSQIFSYISKPWHEYSLKNTLAQAIVYHDLLRENRLLAEHNGTPR